MLPGPTIIKKCAECSSLILEETLMSGNTFGATYWSDGKCEASMLPDQPLFVKCPHCQTSLWIDELEEIGEAECYSEDELYNDAKSYNTLSLKDYFIELIRGNHDLEKEQYLRIRAWWAGNDQRRGIDDKVQSLSEEEKENLDALYNILDIQDENDRIMMAEIKRELGEFNEAESIIKKTYSSEFEPAVSIIKELIKKKTSLVSKL